MVIEIMENIFNYSDKVKKLKSIFAIDEYKNNIPSINFKQIEFATNLVDRVFNLEMDDKIEVNYNRCGMGKSTIIKAILNNIVNTYEPNFIEGCAKVERKPDYNGNGAIIITDRLDRLEEIATYKGLEDRCYLMKYNKEDEDNLYKNNRVEFLEQLKEQKKYPIVLLSTQRYFKMKAEEINNLYTWNCGARKLLICDEKPPIIDMEVIDERYLSNIRIELEELPKCDDKIGLINYWNRYYNDLNETRNNYNEYDINWVCGAGYDYLYKPNKKDKEFFKKLENLASTRLYESIVKLKDINKNGCLFIASGDRDQDNSRKFILIKNNTDKFYTDNCKVIIFDATANNDIHYRISDKYNLFKFDDCKDIDIELHHVTVSTSQYSLKSNEKHLINICNYINSLSDNIFVATYSKKSGLYQKLSKGINSNEIAYFGDIKGKNNWNNYNEMAQIGLNRKSNEVYLATYIALTGIDKKWNELDSFSGDLYSKIESILKNSKGIFCDDLMQEIMESDLIVDTIQNIMRIKCRHFSNLDMCKVFLLCSNSYNSVVERISKGINSEFLKYIPNIFAENKEQNRSKKDGTKTVNQRFKDWYDNWNGEKIEVKLAKEQLGFTDKNWEYIKKSTTWKNICGEFNIVREGKKRYLVKC